MSALAFENFSFANRKRYDEHALPPLIMSTLEECQDKLHAEVHGLAVALYEYETADTTAEKDAARTAIGNAIADLISRLDLMAQRLGLKSSDIVAKRFNEISEAIGSDVRIPL